MLFASESKRPKLDDFKRSFHEEKKKDREVIENLRFEVDFFRSQMVEFTKLKGAF
jgi:hypothetical protein